MSNKKRHRSPSHSDSTAYSGDIDDSVGHYAVVPGTKVEGRYILKKQCGLGTFGKVVMAKDTKYDKDVAIKIIRSIDKYADSAKIEAKILNDVYDKQKKEKFAPCVKMYQSFHLDKHFCLVFEPLGMSLYDFIKKNNYRGFSDKHTRDMSRQLIEAMNFLHSNGIIHTDLKLENILLVDNSYDLYDSNTGQRIDSLSFSHSSSSSSLSSRKKLKSMDNDYCDNDGTRKDQHTENRYHDGGGGEGWSNRDRSSSSKKENRETIASVIGSDDEDIEISRRRMKDLNACMIPRNTKIKIIDFGGATYDSDRKSTIVNTRQYRGPEVTLELGWSYASDMWSCGCIIAEIASGELLFPTHDNLEHLAMMEKSIGYFPWRMISKSRLRSKFFHRDGDVRYEELNHDSKEEIRNCLPLREFCRQARRTDVGSGNSGHRDERGFYQLLRELLILDPKSRVTAKDALSMAYLDSDRRK